MDPLGKECIYAVALEIITGYLERRKRTLREISESNAVKTFCGRALPISTVHYIRRTIDALPLLRSLFRGSQQIPERTYSIAAVNAESLPDTIAGLASSISSLWYDSRLLARGEWWVEEVYLVLKRVLNEKVAIRMLLDKVEQLIRYYENNIAYLTDEMVIYKRRSTDYHLRIRVRRTYLGKGTVAPRGVYELLELKEALEGLRERLNKFKATRVNDPDSTIKHIVKVSAAHLTPFAPRDKYLRIAKSAASEVIVLAAIATIVETLDEELSNLTSSGIATEELAKRVRSRRWRNEIIRRGLKTFQERIKNSRTVRADIISEWLAKTPIKLSRTRITLKDKPRFTILIDIVHPLNLST